MTAFFNWFTKITAFPVQYICFRTKVFYENENARLRNFKGAAIIICNHTSVFDYAVLLFVFFKRTVRYLMAEVLFTRPFLGLFLKQMGGIKVNRGSNDFSFLTKCEKILKNGGAVGIFPESRLPLENEERPLPFKPSAAYLALTCGVPVIPVYTNGSYFRKKHASVMIGEPIIVSGIIGDLSEKEAIETLNHHFRERIISLGKELKNIETA